MGTLLPSEEAFEERRKTMKENKIVLVPFSRKKPTGPGYGPNCQRPDLSAEDFETEKAIFMEKLNHADRKTNEPIKKEKQINFMERDSGKSDSIKEFRIDLQRKSFHVTCKRIDSKAPKSVTFSCHTTACKGAGYSNSRMWHVH